MADSEVRREGRVGGQGRVKSGEGGGDGEWEESVALSYQHPPISVAVFSPETPLLLDGSFRNHSFTGFGEPVPFAL